MNLSFDPSPRGWGGFEDLSPRLRRFPGSTLPGAGRNPPSAAESVILG